ncbi:MAG: radical SAM protein, partial [Oscillospiraceae bacterium]|nr:radical SAM protein [Oscillospiraceae bacterium]
MSDILVARRLAIVPTTNCTLNCKLCGDLLFGPVKRRDIPFEDVCRDIDACFDLLDHVEWLQFVGGEVFIYNDFAKLIRYTQKYRSKFDKLIIETNATVAPNEDERAAMLEFGNDLFVFISNYGTNSYQFDEFVKFMDDNKIEYSIKKYHGENQYYNGWIDNTNPVDLKEPGDVLEVNSKNCPQNRLKNMHVFDGEMHRCSNSCFMLQAGCFPPKDR